MRGYLEEGVSKSPSFVERLLGAVVLPIGIDVTLFLGIALLRWGPFGHGSYPRFSHGSHARLFYFSVLAFLGITVISAIVGFIAGFYRSFWLLEHFWSSGTPRDGRATAMVWLCVALAGLVGILSFRLFIEP